MHVYQYNKNKQYDVQKLWEIKPSKVQQLNLSNLMKSLYSECWGEPPGQIRPIDVIYNRYPEGSHWERIKRANLSFPIIVCPDNHVADGYHRLCKAFICNYKTISAYQFQEWEEMEKAIIRENLSKKRIDNMLFDLKVGYACNNDCIHCVVADKRKTRDLTTQEIKNIITHHSGLDKICFTGGEATIRKDFIELLEFARSKGVNQIFLQTNGRQFCDNTFAKKASKYLDSILVAIHSYDADIHDAITGKKGSFHETIQGVKNLIQINKANTSTQTVLSKKNCMDLVKTFNFIQTIAPVTMNLTFPHPNGNAWTDFNNVVPQYKTIKDELYRCYLKHGKKLFLDAIPHCYIHPYVNWVNIHQRYTHNSEPISGVDFANAGGGQFNTDGITQDYLNILLSDYRKADTCKECIYFYECPGVWKEYFEKYKDELDIYPVTSMNK